MPWRQIHSSVAASASLAALTSDAERLFWRMLAQSDTWGRMRGEPAKVRITCAPMLDWDDARVDELLAELEAAGRIARYDGEARSFVQLLDFDEHQPESARKRGRSHFPDPPDLPETPAKDKGAEVRTSPEHSGEGRMKWKGVGSERTTPAISSPGAQALIAHLADEATRLGLTLPSQTKGQCARTVKRLLDDGMSDPTLRTALTRMLERSRPAAALTDIAREVEANPVLPDKPPDTYNNGTYHRLTPEEAGYHLRAVKSA